MTHKFRVGEQEGYITVGLYDDGTPGEVFVKISKEGSTVSGLTDAIAILTSIALQYGVPLDKLAEKLEHTHFEPAGPTANEDLPFATSILDYIFQLAAAALRPCGVSPRCRRRGRGWHGHDELAPSAGRDGLGADVPGLRGAAGVRGAVPAVPVVRVYEVRVASYRYQLQSVGDN